MLPIAAGETAGFNKATISTIIIISATKIIHTIRFFTTCLNRIAEIANEKSNCIIPPFPSGAFHPALNNKWLVQVKFWSDKLNLILSSEERGSEGEADVGGAAGEADIVNLAGLEGGFVRFPNPLITGTK